MNNFKYIFLFCIIIYSCTSIYKKSESSDINKLYYKINYHGKKYNSTIYLTSGEIYSAHNLEISSDSTHWINIDTNQIDKVETSNIHKIIIKNPVKGTLIGTGAGLIVGE